MLNEDQSGLERKQRFPYPSCSIDAMWKPKGKAIPAYAGSAKRGAALWVKVGAVVEPDMAMPES